MTSQPLIRADIDRRGDTRAQLLVQVEYVAESVYSLGRSRNISVSGLLISTRETLPLGASVTLRLVLPVALQAIPVEVHGTIGRVKAGEYMAIQFKDLKPDQREAIAQYIQQSAETGW